MIMIKGTYQLLKNTFQAAGMGVVIEQAPEFIKNETFTNYLSRTVAYLPQIPKSDVIASYLPLATSAASFSGGIACFGVVRIADIFANLAVFGQLTSKSAKQSSEIGLNIYTKKSWIADHIIKNILSLSITVIAGAVAGGVIGFGAGAMGATAMSVAALALAAWGTTKATDFAFYCAGTVLEGAGKLLYGCGTCLTSFGNFSSNAGNTSSHEEY